MHGRDLAIGRRMELQTSEDQPIVEAGEVREIASEPIECLNDDDLKEPLLNIELEPLKRRSEPTGPALSSILVGLHQAPALRLNIASAHLDLIREGLFALELGTEAGVNDGPD